MRSTSNCFIMSFFIEKAIGKIYSKDFRDMLSTVENPYGEGDVSGKILNVLKNEPIPKEPMKEFYDL